MKKIQDAEIRGKKVLLRTDFNVPIEDYTIVDDLRIREALPTIKYLLEKGAVKIVIITHLGRPDGYDDKYCLWPIANRLMELLGIDNKYYDCPQNEYRIGENIVMRENIRFNADEEANNPEFAKQLAGRADSPRGEAGIFVNDAFGTLHRAHASTVGVAKILPSFAGLLVQKEVAELNKILINNLKPFTLVLGGAKIADKLPLIKNFISRADNFLIGGAIGNTFLTARRHYLGRSLVEEKSLKEVNQIYKMIMDEPKRNIYLPEDIVLSKSAQKKEDRKIVKIAELLQPSYEEYVAVDIGPRTCELFQKVIARSKLIFWNGNMGISEVEEFSRGTGVIAEAIVQSLAQKYAGGGDTVSFIRKAGLADKFDFLSTGGGATLEYLAGKVLPGLKVLEQL